MALFLEILTTVTMPIMLLMALGWIVRRRLDLDVRTLGRFLLNVVLPCALFHFLTQAELPLIESWPTVIFTLVQFFVFTAIGWGIAILFRLPVAMRPVAAVALAFANTGNFGLPVAQLAFEADLLLHQTLMLSLHTVLIIPFGLLLLSRNGTGLLDSLKVLAFSPMILAVAAGLIVKGTGLSLPFVVTHPISLVAGGYIAVALFTLGAQLAETKVSLAQGPVWLCVATKLLLAPLLTWAGLAALGLDEQLTDLIIVASAAPVGLLLAILCLDHDRVPDFASAIVLATTLLSPITVTFWILATRLA